MRKWLLLMVMVAFGFMFLGAGCGAKNFITADDLKAGTTITVKWSWQGINTVVTPAKYKVWSATSPLPGAPWTQIYGGATGGTATTLDDTIGAAAVRFYKVQAFAADNTPSDTSWPEGGSTVGVPVDPVPEQATLRIWESAGDCIHKYTELLHPDVGTPADPLPLHIDQAGSAGGNLHVDMYLSTVGGLDAIAEFFFTNFNDTCTNLYTYVDAWQYAPVDVTNFNGNMYGYADYGAAGWESYELIVTAKHASGGHWYMKSGANPVAYMAYADAPWLDCLACAAHTCLCP
jgi:hypothetical protein